MRNASTMNGVFTVPKIKYVFCLLFILSGSFIAIRFGIWGVDAIRAGAAGMAVFGFVFVIIGLLFGVFAIFLFIHNKGAYLTADGQKIDARFGFGDELHEPVSKIKKATLTHGGSGIELYFADRICRIINLQNAKEICTFILSVNSGARYVMSVADAEANLIKRKKRFAMYLALTVVFTAAIFAHIAWCFLLTEGREPGAFSQRDNMVFLGFAAAELITVTITFMLAGKCGKQNKLWQLSKASLLSAAATEHKNDSLDKYPNVISKKYFEDNTYRIVIFAPEADVFAYMLERFELSAGEWVCCYDAARGFEYLSELFDSIDESFEDVILED